MAEGLNYDKIELPVQEKDFNKIEVKNNICTNVFGYENRLVFPIYISDQKFKDSMDLLLLIDNNKSHYVRNVKKGLIQKNIKTIFLVVLLIKLFVLIIDLLSQPLFIGLKMQLTNLLK